MEPTISIYLLRDYNSVNRKFYIHRVVTSFSEK
jgi:hypothetical protein